LLKDCASYVIDTGSNINFTSIKIVKDPYAIFRHEFYTMARMIENILYKTIS
jgi:hypothetical protein